VYACRNQHGGNSVFTKTSFGQWLKQRRNTLDLTRDDLANLIGCAVITLYKIEADKRRPSKQIAELLAQHLNIPLADRAVFIRFARAEAIKSDAPFGTPFHPPTNLPAPPTPIIGRDAGLAAAQRQPERAARLLGAAETQREAAHTPRVGLDRYYDSFLAATRVQLDAAALAVAWAEGSAMTFDQAVDYARET
jgi:DNA-binding XRE family transcriptional regulator